MEVSGDIDAAAGRLRDDWNLLDLRRSNEHRQTFEVVPGDWFRVWLAQVSVDLNAGATHQATQPHHITADELAELLWSDAHQIKAQTA